MSGQGISLEMDGRQTTHSVHRSGLLIIPDHDHFDPAIRETHAASIGTPALAAAGRHAATAGNKDGRARRGPR
jgi:hypothetical protein